MTFQLAAEPLVVRNLFALPDWEGRASMPVRFEPLPLGASTVVPISESNTDVRNSSAFVLDLLISNIR